MKLKRKPDLMVVLAIVVGLGVIASSFAQGMLGSSNTKAAQLGSAYTAQAMTQTDNQVLIKKN
jgi:F0F1-type ATP synthase membrane subunit c/vacuolar-type H+-ATPase subunit K